MNDEEIREVLEWNVEQTNAMTEALRKWNG